MAKRKSRKWRQLYNVSRRKQRKKPARWWAITRSPLVCWKKCNTQSNILPPKRVLEITVNKLWAERDACLTSLQIGQKKMAKLVSRKNIHWTECFFDLSLKQGSRSSKFFLPPTTTIISRLSAAAPRIYITNFSIDRALLVWAKEIAACVAMSMRNLIE